MGWEKLTKPLGGWSKAEKAKGGWEALGQQGGCSDWSGVGSDGGCSEWDSGLCWILDAGAWSDTCYWKDTSFWNDGVPFWGELVEAA